MEGNGFGRKSKIDGRLEFSKFCTYIDSLVYHLQNRFVPWPTWLTLGNECFNFCKALPAEIKTNSFSLLLEEPSGPVPLIEEEKARLRAEYTTLLLISQDIQENSKANTPEEIWYLLLTEMRYYEHCLNVNDF